MKKKPVKIFKYECPVYGVLVHLVICPADVFEPMYNKKYGGNLTIGPQSQAMTLYYDEKDWDWPTVIWLSPGCGLPELVHECFHAARHCLLKHNIFTGVEDTSQEVMAYLLDHMFESLYTQWAKSIHKKVDMF